MAASVLRWSGLMLILGAVVLGVAIAILSLNPTMGQPLSPTAGLLLLVSSILLLIALPGMYARQADAAGLTGIIGFVLLQAGVVLLTLTASTPILFPSQDLVVGENYASFLLGIAFVLGLLLTGIATMKAGVFPRWAGVLLLGATAGFCFDFFIAEFLPPIAGQLGNAFFGIVLGLALGCVGFAMWTGEPWPTRAVAR